MSAQGDDDFVLLLQVRQLVLLPWGLDLVVKAGYLSVPGQGLDVLQLRLAELRREDLVVVMGSGLVNRGRCCCGSDTGFKETGLSLQLLHCCGFKMTRAVKQRTTQMNTLWL